MVFQRFRNFGRTIFSYYDKYPLLMNSCAGGAVYSGGEFIVQMQQCKEPITTSSLEYKRLAEVAALGSAENGIVMLTWYNLLNRFVGSGVGTGIVLIKCFLDQMFFATQQDFLFLALCAYDHSHHLSEAIEEVRKNFLTTWLMDCALWPVVNFIGFAVVPMKLQPTYMAAVSLFWQVYVSSVTNKAEHDESAPSTEADLRKIFNDIDTDNSGFIDAEELNTALNERGIKAKAEDIQQMIADGDTEQADGKISFEEFKIIVKKGSALPTADLWKTVRQDRRLDKGAKVAIRKLEDMKKKKEKEKEKEAAATALALSSSPTAVATALSEEAAEFFEVNQDTQKAAESAAAGISFLAVASIARKLIFRV